MLNHLGVKLSSHLVGELRQRLNYRFLTESNAHLNAESSRLWQEEKCIASLFNLMESCNEIEA